MKTITSLALAWLCLFSSATSYAQNALPANGNVGIGTATPNATFEIRTGTDQNIRFHNFGNAGLAVYNDQQNALMPFKIYGNVLLAPENSGSVGIGTTSPSYRLDVNGEARVSGAFRIGELYFSSLQTIYLSIGTERWVKLATIPNNHYVRFQIRNGSQNSEEVAEVKVFGTYHNDRTAISVERQTYNEHLREVRVVGSDGGLRTVYIKIRADSYAPSVVWRAMDSMGTITIHNVEEAPSGGLSHFVSGDKVSSTNANFVTSSNVGIGTTSPSAKLHVVNGDNTIGSILATNNEGPGELRVHSYTTQPSVVPSFGIVHAFYNDERNGFIKFWRGNSACGGFLTFGTGGDERLRLDPAGNVGIGTTSPTEKLSVNGRIRAKEVIVETTGWSDYVFAKDYKLASLSEVEQHIEQQGYLPGVPSAQEVAEKGVSVGDMQAILLAKIEELTLHQIAQQKQLDAQRVEIATLKAENALIKH